MIRAQVSSHPHPLRLIVQKMSHVAPASLIANGCVYTVTMYPIRRITSIRLVHDHGTWLGANCHCIGRAHRNPGNLRLLVQSALLRLHLMWPAKIASAQSLERLVYRLAAAFYESAIGHGWIPFVPYLCRYRNMAGLASSTFGGYLSAVVSYTRKAKLLSIAGGQITVGCLDTRTFFVIAEKAAEPS
jgi:hypothetical protein